MIFNPIKRILDLLFPPLCYGCDENLVNNNILCTNCWSMLPFSDHFDHKENKVIEHFYGRSNIEHGAALLLFGKSGIVQHLMHQFKYNKQQDIGLTFGTILANKIMESSLFPNIDYIIPVPMHREKRKTRGYNPASLISTVLTKELDIPNLQDVLIKKENNPTQTNKNRSERQSNVKNAFEIKNAQVVKGKSILLVDDIITTGATSGKCCELLKENGAKKISVVALGAATTDYII